MSVFDGLRFRKVYSPIHNLDPRIKFVYVIAIFVVAIIFYQRQWLRSLRGAAFLASFIFVVNVATTYFTSGYTFTAFNVETAAAMTLRFVVLVESFSVFFLTTSPDHLGLALEESRVPYEFAFAFTTAVRFVPVLAEEAQTIMDAQKARGLELEKGGLLKRIRNYVPVLIPLIVSAIRRSLELAEAMESRAWGATKKRTNLYLLKLHKGDFALLAITVGILAAAVYVHFFVLIPTISQLL
jgi:energy-coupling factor transport system permease protein